MQDMNIPTKNRKSNNHKNDGESADAIPNTKSKAEELRTFTLSQMLFLQFYV